MSQTDWIGKSYTLDYLKQEALGRGPYDDRAFVFLQEIGVIPKDISWSRRNALPRTALNGEKLMAGYLAEVAYEWDLDGFSTAQEFVDMLEFEVKGTDKNETVSEVMGDLGK